MYTLSWGNKTEFGRKCIVAEPLRDIELKYFLRKCIVEKREKNIFFGISYFFLFREKRWLMWLCCIVVDVLGFLSNIFIGFCALGLVAIAHNFVFGIIER